MSLTRLALVLLLVTLAGTAFAADIAPLYPNLASACEMWGGETKMVNALWWENPPELRFGDGRNMVVIADVKGPGVITMIHFAMPGRMKLNRDTVLRIFWDGEKSPSVEAPMVDFFCDPNGALERVDTALVNKKRGWNCYFPMPFAKSARVELAYENSRLPNAGMDVNPCYSYVMYRTLRQLPPGVGYFHANWRQEKLLLGATDYVALEAAGNGQFIGWNVTVRAVGSPSAGYPVDENAKFYVDGESEPSIEWQGIEDAFGFSFGFPEQANGFPYTGFQPYYNGAAAYRFTLNDRISFGKSLKVTIGFGKNEHPVFRELFSKPENALELSSAVYWYQKEPHRPLDRLLGANERKPSGLASAYKPLEPGTALAVNCGSLSEDEDYVKPGWDYSLKKGYTYSGWPTQVKHCWADWESLQFDIICPKGAVGVLKMYILDGDGLAGGREQSVTVAGRPIGEYRNFQTGVWIETPVTEADTRDGRIPVVIKNLKPGCNAVVSIIRFVESP